jgi:epoxide hydrolase 4
MTSFNERYFELGDIRLHYVEGGQLDGTAPLILFYHGFPSFWYSFHLQMEAFADDYHVVAVDGLGANLSSRPADLEYYKIENLANQIDELARHLAGDKKFYLVGHDWGGALAWAYAQQYPERLNKLVVLSAPPYNQLLSMLQANEMQRERSSYMYSMRDGDLNLSMTQNNNQRVCDNICKGLSKLPHFNEDMERTFREGLGVPGAIDAGINWYRANIPPVDAITDEDFWPGKHASTSVPSLLIWGDADLTFVPEFIDDLADYAENLRVHHLPEVGHSPMLEKPAEVNAVIRRFLATGAG